MNVSTYIPLTLSSDTSSQWPPPPTQRWKSFSPSREEFIDYFHGSFLLVLRYSKYVTYLTPARMHPCMHVCTSGTSVYDCLFNYIIY